MINPNRVPSILLDFPRNRIRINKSVLKSLNNPTYVRLLINPDTRSIAIEACDDTEPRKHRIPSYVKNSKQCFEIRSMSFFEQLAIHTQWDTHLRYKVCAMAQAGEQLLRKWLFIGLCLLRDCREVLEIDKSYFRPYLRF